MILLALNFRGCHAPIAHLYTGGSMEARNRSARWRSMAASRRRGRRAGLQMQGAMYRGKYVTPFSTMTSLGWNTYDV